MLPQVDPLPSEEDQRRLNFCPYHRRRGHNLEQCVVFRKIFDQKLEAGEILFQGEGPKMCTRGRSLTITKGKRKPR